MPHFCLMDFSTADSTENSGTHNRKEHFRLIILWLFLVWVFIFFLLTVIFRWINLIILISFLFLLESLLSPCFLSHNYISLNLPFPTPSGFISILISFLNLYRLGKICPIIVELLLDINSGIIAAFNRYLLHVNIWGFWWYYCTNIFYF